MILAFDGTENYFLSNFEAGPDLSGIQAHRYITAPCATVEHYFQAAKATNTVDALHIISASTPGHAKRLGRSVQLRANWEAIKYDVMLTGLRAKFDPQYHPLNVRALLATGYQRLVEGNGHGDRTWGAVWIPQTDSDPAQQIVWATRGDRTEDDPAEYLVGHNWLGRLLELVREEVRPWA